MGGYMNLYNLKNFLREDIFAYRIRTSSLQEEKEILVEAIKDLENGKVSEIAKDLLYDKYRILLTPYNTKDLLPTLKNDLFMMAADV